MPDVAPPDTPYPISSSGTLAPDQSLSVAFRPARAGPVNVILVALGFPPQDKGGGDDPKQPAPYTMNLLLEVFKPASGTAVVSKPAALVVEPRQSNRLITSVETPCLDADLSADWTARVTNSSDGPTSCTVTARYQVVAGNLGKIDHIVVLMMENRSFDHMLGYLRLEGGRSDIDGLTGTEANKDAKGHDVLVHPMASDGRANPTYFANDPGHGWPDVAGSPDKTDLAYQLQPDVFTGQPNSGFVQNFAKKLSDDATSRPPITDTVHDEGWITAGQERVVQFRPVLTTPISASSRLTGLGVTHSETGQVAELELRRPGNAEPIATASVGLNETSIGLSYAPTNDDLAVPGNWTCSLTNLSDAQIHVATEVTIVTDLHDTTRFESPGAIMGYYNKNQLPAYDLLAGEFAVCNRWFASVPTDTFPNRLYSLTGGSGGLVTTPTDQSVMTQPPGYTLKTIFEVLQERGVDWMIFFSVLPFQLIFKTLAQDAQYTRRMRQLGDLLARAESGDLPAVTWIEPNFSDVEESIGEPPDKANDDHAPGYIDGGQRLVSQVYNALSSGPAWSKTLLLIMYDEHGGFYDHVRPPGTPAQPGQPPGPDGPPDDDPQFRRYGVRVPAFVVSPWVARGSVSNDVFDHTSILATILRRFCGVAVPSMGERTDNAHDIGSLLSADAPRLVPAMGQPPSVPSSAPIPASDPTAFGAMLRSALFGF